MSIIIQALLFVLPPFLVGFFTLPYTNGLAGGNALIQNCYLGGLRLIWTIFVLAFLKYIAKDDISYIKYIKTLLCKK